MPDAFLISSILLEFEITVFKYMFCLIVPVKIQRAANLLPAASPNAAPL